MEQPWVALLTLLHPRVPAHVDVPLSEAGGGLGAQPLHDGALAAVREELRRRAALSQTEHRSSEDTQSTRTLLLTWSPLTAMGYMTYLPP